MKKIGIIGAGIMASGMALNFLKANYGVFIWNRSKDKLERITKAGGEAKSSPREVAVSSDIIIECVSDDKASKSVWLGSQGILAGASSNKVLIASSSLSIGWIDELASLCQTEGYKFIDMPLTGSRVGAETGTLRLLMGGDQELINSIQKDLAVISDKMYRFGPAGYGMRFKLILNSLIGIHMDAIAQAQNVAKKAGIDPTAFGQALIDGSMGPASPSTKLVIDSRNWPPGHINFSSQLLEKDLKYAKFMTQQFGVDFTLLDLALSDYTRLNNQQSNESDVTSIANLYDN